MNRTVVKVSLVGAAALAALLLLILATQPLGVFGQQDGAPARPTGLTGDVYHDRVELTWDDPGDSSITGYRILRLDRAVHGLGNFQVHVSDTGSAEASYTDTRVEASTRYVYRIKARYGDDIGPRSSYFNADTPPAAPTGLTGTAEHDRVSLSWDDPGDGSITGYQVLRGNRVEGVETEFQVLANNTGSSATSHVDTGVEPETGYAYRVRARNRGGLSPESADFNADTPAAPEAPDPPTGLTGTVFHDRVELTWDDPVDSSITGYRILRLDRAVHGLGNFQVHVSDTGSARTSYVDTGVEASTSYVYRIEARYGDDISPRSKWFNADTPAEPETPETPDPPGAPTGLAGTAEHNRVSLSWDDPDDGSITGYQVLRGNRVEGQETDFAVLVDDTGSPGTSYVDDSVEPETAHTYRVRARNAGGLGPPSGDFDADTPAAPVPAAPTLTGTAWLPEGQVVLSWQQDPADDSITGYRILRGVGEDALAEIVEDTGNSETTYTDTAPPTGQTLYYAVQARNPAGLSPPSNTWAELTPASLPPAPNGLTALPAHNRVMLTWDDPEDDSVTGYSILRGTDAGSLRIIETDTGNSNFWYDDTSVSEGADYVYAVKAINQNGRSAPSDTVEVSTLRAPSIRFVESGEEEPLIAQQQQEGNLPTPPHYLGMFASHDRVILRWSFPCCNNPTGFRILRGPSADALTVLVQDTGRVSPRYDDRTVESNTTYVYGIKSLNDNGESPEAKLLSVTTLAEPADTENILVSNMGARNTNAPTGSAARVGSGKAIQVFTTGGHTSGYDLTGVIVDIFREGRSPIDPKVSIYSVTPSGRPQSLLYALTPPTRDETLPAQDGYPDLKYVSSHLSEASGPEHYTAPDDAQLSANTSYAVVFEQGSATDQNYARTYYTVGTPGGGANSGGADGWSIGYTMYIDSSKTQVFGTRRQIAIVGTVRPAD